MKFLIFLISLFLTTTATAEIIYPKTPEDMAKVSVIVEDYENTTGGSGVVVTPVTYIFEEEPSAYRNMLNELEV